MSKECELMHREDISTIILKRAGKGNSLSRDLVASLHEMLDRCFENNTKALLIRAEGKHFCTGFDLADLESESDDSLLARFVEIELLLQKIYWAPFATLAIGQGSVIGAGADIFASCTYRIALDTSSFTFPGAKFGLVLGSRRLAARVGTSLARDWINASRKISAADALTCGLATHLSRIEEQDSLVAELLQGQRLPQSTQRQVYRATAQDQESQAADLQALILSIMPGGIKQRITAYVNQ
ncbi:enoyl-CoA hydratase/isomerase family protein [Advenella sp. WQ 585]|uniref:Enoyl-CoA hydratase/isomerase family protein n=1 Tax=Advenella mandrilli TaxID=2800330 RepID=A0ABS1EDM6_9BURK|nr:enoyl-CoA hydratase/isomerase family protein [Advenella mandrilli]MBK1780206.1 enoyl-CoA hydratase/isomerase family protein [Advenella mandrilli]